MPAPLASPRSRTPVALTGVAAMAAGGLYFVNPNTTHVPLCPLHAMTGLWCPICGCTRAVYALLHGHFVTATQDNLLFVLGLPLLAWCWWRWLNREPGQRLVPRWLFWTLLAIGLIFGVVRNLPIGAGLAPPA